MNPLMFTMLGRQAAKTYTETGEPLNSAIAKLASEHDLTRLQIQRVVESANHAANDALRKTAEDKTYTFELASLDNVLAELQSDTPGLDMTKVAQLAKDLNKRRGAPDLDKLASSMPIESDEEPVRRLTETNIALEKVASRARKYSQEAESTRVSTLDKLAGELDSLTQMAKDYVLLKGGKITDFQKYAETAFPEFEKGWGVIFTKVASDLEKLGHPFTGALATVAEMAKDRERLNKTEGIRPLVINGRSALYGALESIRQRISVCDRMLDRKRELDNFHGTIRTYQKEIRDNGDVQPEIHKLAQNMEKISQNEDPLVNLIKNAGLGVAIPLVLGATAVNEPAKTATKAGWKELTKDNVPGKHSSKATPRVYSGK